MKEFHICFLCYLMLLIWFRCHDKTPKIIYIHIIPRPIGEDLGYTRSYTNNKHSSRQFAPCAQYVFDIPIPRHIITQTNPANICLIKKGNNDRKTTTLIKIKLPLTWKKRTLWITNKWLVTFKYHCRLSYMC